VYSGNVSVNSTLSATSLVTTNRPTFGGNTAWDAGNFNPANYAALATANAFTGSMTVGGTLLVGGAPWAASGFSARNNATNVWACSAWASVQSGGAFIGRTDAAAVPLASWFFGTNNVGIITTNGSSTTYGTTSDYRLKANYNAIKKASATLSKIKFYEGEFKSQPGVRSHYVIAHELQKVLAFAVAGDKDAVNEDGSIKPQVVDYSKIVPLLGAAIQELLERVAVLEAKEAA
jgi:hypothetical protein